MWYELSLMVTYKTISGGCSSQFDVRLTTATRRHVEFDGGLQGIKTRTGGSKSPASAVKVGSGIRSPVRSRQIAIQIDHRQRPPSRAPLGRERWPLETLMPRLGSQITLPSYVNAGTELLVGRRLCFTSRYCSFRKTLQNPITFEKFVSNCRFFSAKTLLCLLSCQSARFLLRSYRRAAWCQH
jgi:hypothetical protein